MEGEGSVLVYDLPGYYLLEYRPDADTGTLPLPTRLSAPTPQSTPSYWLATDFIPRAC